VKTSFLLAAITTALVTLAGCSSHDRSAPAPSSGNEQDVSATTLQSQLVGTWNIGGDAPNDAPFSSFTLSADSTFQATRACVSTPGAATCHSITFTKGTWTLQKSGPQLGAPAGAQQIKLTDSFNQDSVFFLSLSGGTLTLSESLIGSKFPYTKGAAPPDGDGACTTAGDCHGAISHNCSVCADGGTSCAHWTCKQSQCVIATCE
jgi:hypothetical protein